MHALARQSVQVGRQRCNERFAFARLHFGDAALVQGDAADDLYMIMFEFENAPRRLAHDRERVVEDVVQRFAVFQTIFQYVRLLAQLRIRHRRVLRFELLDLARHFVQLAQAAPAVAVH